MITLQATDTKTTDSLTALRLLVVEDDEADYRLVMRSIAAHFRLTSQRVQDDRSLRTALEEQVWDAVLCDYSLPGYSAAEALAVVAECRLDYPVIVVSGVIGEDRAAEIMRAGAHDVVSKNKLVRLPQALERELANATTRREHRELEVRSKDLQRSNTELDQFAAIAAHDLQEPLRMITSYSDLLQMRFGDRLEDKGREYLAVVIDGAKRMQHLIRSILDYSRVGQEGIKTGQFESDAVARSSLLNLEQKIHVAGAAIDCGLLPSIVADPVLFGQLLQNLVSNAIKFGAKDRQPKVIITAHESEREWTFSVADNGIGIGAEDLERIFILFQKLHPAAEYPGSGIGLATCRKIVERHGGRLWVESTIGVGTTFFFTLPK